MNAPTDTISQSDGAAYKKQAALDKAALLALDAMKEGKAAARLALRAETKPARIEAAKTADRAGTAAFEAVGLLVDAGAVIPEWQAQAEQAEQKAGLDLRELDTMDTPTARELLTLLETATACAERLDAERGRVLPAHLPTGEGESRGVDFAESISELTQRLRGEIFGRSGNGEGG